MRVVTAPLVIATDDEGARHHLYRGMTVPSYVRGEQWSRLREDGMVENVELVVVEEPVVVPVVVEDPAGPVEPVVVDPIVDAPPLAVEPDGDMVMEPEPVPEKSQPRRR